MLIIRVFDIESIAIQLMQEQRWEKKVKVVRTIIAWMQCLYTMYIYTRSKRCIMKVFQKKSSKFIKKCTHTQHDLKTLHAFCCRISCAQREKVKRVLFKAHFKAKMLHVFKIEWSRARMRGLKADKSSKPLHATMRHILLAAGIGSSPSLSLYIYNKRYV